MPCLQPYKDAGTPHRHRCHLLPHIRLYTLPLLAALATKHRIALPDFYTANPFDDRNLKILSTWLSTSLTTKSHLPYVTPTAPHLHSRYFLACSNTRGRLGASCSLMNENLSIQNQANQTSRTQAGKHHQTAAPPSINPSPYPSPANHSDNGNKNKTSTAMPKSNSQS